MRFEDLDVWKRSSRLSADIYKEFMGLKDYGFKDQITRSGLSVPSNIAEGFERGSNRDCVKFLLYPLCQDSCHFSPREFVLGSGAKESDNNYEQQVFKRVQRKHYREDVTSRECTGS
jgi:hypothetical protein